MDDILCDPRLDAESMEVYDNLQEKGQRNLRPADIKRKGIIYGGKMTEQKVKSINFKFAIIIAMDERRLE
jgi:hypothetical protein